MNKLKIDDLVVLKSGGPIMTVIGLSNGPTLGPGAITQWLDDNGDSRSGHFLEVCLKTPTEAEICSAD